MSKYVSYVGDNVAQVIDAIREVADGLARVADAIGRTGFDVVYAVDALRFEILEASLRDRG